MVYLLALLNLRVAVSLILCCSTAFGKQKVLFGDHFGKENMKPVTVYNELPTPEVFYKEHLKGNKPAVVKGAAWNWPALKKWQNMSYLIEMAADAPHQSVQLRKLYDYDTHHFIDVSMGMEEFISRLKKNENVYLDSPLPRGLVEDVIWPKFLACDWWLKQLQGVQLFFNRGQSSTDSHVDNTETMFAQILGRRQWILNPHTDTLNLYSGERFWDNHMSKSQLDPDNVNVKTHPNSLKADYHIAIAEPGDLVYCPESWFHQVKTMDNPNIAVAIYHKVLRCEHWLAHLSEDHEFNAACEKVRSHLPDEIKCTEPPEADMLPLNVLARKHPDPEGLAPVCKKDNCRPTLESIAEAEKSTYCSWDFSSKENNKVIVSSARKGIRIQNFGVSLYGMRAEHSTFEDIVGIVKNGYKTCSNGFVVSEEDGSLDWFVKAIDLIKEVNRKILRPIVVVKLETILAQEHPAEYLKVTVENIKKKIDTIAVLLLEAPYCSGGNEKQNTTSSCQRMTDKWEQWISIWKITRKLWEDGTVYSVGVRDFSAPELRKLLEIETVHKKRQALQVVSARVDPFYRNVEIQSLVSNHHLHLIPHGLMGSFYPPPNPLTKSHIMLVNTFKTHSTIFSSAVQWGLYKRFLVMPRVRNDLQLRMLKGSKETGPDVGRINDLVREDTRNVGQEKEENDEEDNDEQTEEHEEKDIGLPDKVIFHPFSDEIIQVMRKGKGIAARGSQKDEL